jgi:hypothetical protein
MLSRNELLSIEHKSAGHRAEGWMNGLTVHLEES